MSGIQGDDPEKQQGPDGSDLKNVDSKRMCVVSSRDHVANECGQGGDCCCGAKTCTSVLKYVFPVVAVLNIVAGYVITNIILLMKEQVSFRIPGVQGGDFGYFDGSCDSTNIKLSSTEKSAWHVIQGCIGAYGLFFLAWVPVIYGQPVTTKPGQIGKCAALLMCVVSIALLLGQGFHGYDHHTDGVRGDDVTHQAFFLDLDNVSIGSWFGLVFAALSWGATVYGIQGTTPTKTATRFAWIQGYFVWAVFALSCVYVALSVILFFLVGDIMSDIRKQICNMHGDDCILTCQKLVAFCQNNAQGEVLAICPSD